MTQRIDNSSLAHQEKPLEYDFDLDFMPDELTISDYTGFEFAHFRKTGMSHNLREKLSKNRFFILCFAFSISAHLLIVYLALRYDVFTFQLPENKMLSNDRI